MSSGNSFSNHWYNNNKCASGPYIGWVLLSQSVVRWKEPYIRAALVSFFAAIPQAMFVCLLVCFCGSMDLGFEGTARPDDRGADLLGKRIPCP